MSVPDWILSDLFEVWKKRPVCLLSVYPSDRVTTVLTPPIDHMSVLDSFQYAH
jgi:hypothetical protein